MTSHKTLQRQWLQWGREDYLEEQRLHFVFQSILSCSKLNIRGMSFLWQCSHTPPKGMSASLAGTPAKEPLLERACRAFPHSFSCFVQPSLSLMCLCLLSPLRFHDQHRGALSVCRAVPSSNREPGCVCPEPCWGAGRAQKFAPKLPLDNHAFGTRNTLPRSDFFGSLSLCLLIGFGTLIGRSVV